MIILNIAAIVMFAGSTVSAFPPPGLCDTDENCGNINATNAKVLNESGPRGYTSDLVGFTPDRRPIAIINPFSGTIKCTQEDPPIPGGYRLLYNPFGFRTEFDTCEDIDENGIIDAEEWILAEFDTAWDAGFRRFVIQRPGGTLSDNTLLMPGDTSDTNHVQQEMFEHLQDWRKGIYTNAVAGWFSTKLSVDPSAELGVFIGSRQNNSCDPCHTASAGVNEYAEDCDTVVNETYFDCTGTNSLDTREMNASIRASAELTYKATRPWMDAGFNAFWFDATSNEKLVPNETLSEAETILAMQDNPDYSLVKIAGEAIPRADPGPLPQTMIAAFIENAAWLGTYSYMVDAKYADPDYPGLIVPVNPVTTEIVCAFHNPNGPGLPYYDIQDVAAMRNNGYVLAAWDDFAQPFIQRVDDDLDDTLAAIDIVDFDGNGAIDCWDRFRFQLNWCNSLYKVGLVDPAVWDGDIDDDGDVDNDDALQFEIYWIALTGLSCADQVCEEPLP